jgi:hypothetical protein
MHYLRGGFLVAGIERDGADFFVARYLVDSRRNFAGTLEISVGQGNRIHLRRARHVECCRGAHHAGTNY